MPSDFQPSTGRWHAVGLTAFLLMLALYAAAGWHVDGAAADPDLYWILGGAGLVALVVALAGQLRDWHQRRALLVGWPVAALVVTVLAGALEPDATRYLPGMITIAFMYVGFTCPPWRSFALVPLGVVAFVVGGAKDLPGATPTVVVTAVMWVLVAEVPAHFITRLQQQSALLHEIAQTDALTKLLNRSTLASQLATHATDSTVVLIDLDDFKGHNDRHGHDAGDDVLVAFADALRSSVRKGDSVFRIGGDEFLLLLVGADETEARHVCDRLRRRWAEMGEPVDFSTGIASGDQDLLRLADERMYAAKRSRARPPQNPRSSV